MRGAIAYIILFIFIPIVLNAQDERKIEGTVSYITAQHIYVKFSDTRDIAVGDTLFIQLGEDKTANLLVHQKSSTSCVCLNDAVPGVEIGLKVIHNKKVKQELENPIENEHTNLKVPDINQIDSTPISLNKKEVALENKGKLSARLTLSNQNLLSNEYDNKHRFIGRFSIRMDRINNSKLSLESYLNYRQNINVSSAGKEREGYFRVYNLALKYEQNEDLSFHIGRKVNRKIASIGAVDGIQVEKYFGSFYAGAIAGFRPDYYNYGLNTNLFQYGMYSGFSQQKDKYQSQTTFGLIEQRNGLAVDRRYGYFQYSSSVNRKLNIFTSMEIDLYNNINGEPKTNVRLSNFYISTRYRINRKINLSISYDARKRILLYETLKTEIERLLDDDEARQGVRIRINIRPFKYINTGISYSRRFQNDAQNLSNNINGYMSISKVPLIAGRFVMNYNMNQSIYLKSNIVSFRYSRGFLKKKLKGEVYFRHVNYTYQISELKFGQQYYGASFSYKINKSLSLQILSEIAIRPDNRNKRINTRLTKRFVN